MKNRLLKLFIDVFIDTTYCVAYRQNKVSIWEEKVSLFKILKPSLRYWYADPIPFEINGEIYVFVEMYHRFKDIGYIGVSKLVNNTLEKPRVIIKRDTHMSFPIIISYDDDIYMIPENSASGCIQIYKMGLTPYDWEHYAEIPVNETLVDVVYKKTESGDLLLIGTVPHPGTPLKTSLRVGILKNLSDLENIAYIPSYPSRNASEIEADYLYDARNAGPLQYKDEKIYRYIQESTDRIYGLNLIRSEISELSENEIIEEYCEKKTVNDIRTHLPKLLYKVIGTHTYGRTDSGFEVVDLSMAQVSPVPILRKLFGK